MNKFVEAFKKEENRTFTENGSPTFKSSTNACVDLFFMIGALRKEKNTARIESLFEEAYKENSDVALRILLWARDARLGAGERRVFRTLLKFVERRYPEHLEALLEKTPELGRWDDLFSVESDLGVEIRHRLIASALDSGNGLCAKWMPREGGQKYQKERIQLRNHIGLNDKEYRKLMVSLSKTVEQQMSANDWGGINYEHVPSVASARYKRAFNKHDSKRYNEFINAAMRGEKKINAKAVFPHDIIRSLRYSNVPNDHAEAQWKNLPDFVSEDSSFIPLVDVSGSMSCHGVSGMCTAMDVSVSLGIYLAERNKSAFKDLVVTFSTNPQFVKLTGTLKNKVNKTIGMDWGGSTDLDKAMEAIIDLAVKKKVPKKDMPKALLVLSDMEFNSAAHTNSTTSKRILKKFKDAGYDAPQIVWWNIASRQNNVPVKSNKTGAALVSGFSPAIMSRLLGGVEMTPEKIMLDTVMVDRYSI